MRYPHQRRRRRAHRSAAWPGRAARAALVVAAGLLPACAAAPSTWPGAGTAAIQPSPVPVSRPLSTAVPTESASPTATAAPPPTAVALACTNSAVLGRWPLERLAAQTVVVPVSESDPGAVTREVALGAGGVILFGSSAPATLAAQLRALGAQAPQQVAPFVMTDEEGGAVQRMADLVGNVPSAREMGASLTPAQIRAVARDLALRMRAAGVTMDLAPVLDADSGFGPNNLDADGTRSFSADPTVAAADGLAFAAGLRDGGVVGVVKHFPGLGGATGNTDAMAASTLPWSTLQRTGLVPFADAVGSGVPAIMVSNASVPGLSSLPASVSPAVIGSLLRGRLGYRGLVMTDSLSSTALVAAGYSVPRAAAAAVSAGADMVLFTAPAASVEAETEAVIRALVGAVSGGSLPRTRLQSAAEHVLAAKGIDLCG